MSIFRGKYLRKSLFFLKSINLSAAKNLPYGCRANRLKASSGLTVRRWRVKGGNAFRELLFIPRPYPQSALYRRNPTKAFERLPTFFIHRAIRHAAYGSPRRRIIPYRQKNHQALVRLAAESPVTAEKSIKHTITSPPFRPLPPYHHTQGMGKNDTLDHKRPGKALTYPPFGFHIRFISNECNGKNELKREKATQTA